MYKNIDFYGVKVRIKKDILKKIKPADSLIAEQINDMLLITMDTPCAIAYLEKHNLLTNKDRDKICLNRMCEECMREFIKQVITCKKNIINKE